MGSLFGLLFKITGFVHIVKLRATIKTNVLLGLKKLKSHDANK